MPITAFRFQNSTSFRDTGWIELNHLTFIYGDNLAGKSNLHRILHAVKISIQEDLLSDNEQKKSFKLLNYSGLLNNNFSGDAENILQLAFRFNLATRITDNSNILPSSQPIDLHLLFKGNKLSTAGALFEFIIETSATDNENRKVILRGVQTQDDDNHTWSCSSEYYRINWDHDLVWAKINFDNSFPPQMVGLNDDLSKTLKIKVAIDPEKEGNFLLDENQDLVYEDEDISEIVRLSKNAGGVISSLLKMMQVEITDLFEKYTYITPNCTREPIGQPLSIETEKWMRHILFDINEKHALEIENGSGVSSLSYLIQILLDLNDNSVCYLEHPSIYLSSRSQASITDLLIHLVYKKKIKFIIETHSEQMLLRLRKRIKQLNKARYVPAALRDLEDFTREDHLSRKSIILFFKKDIFNFSKIALLHLDKTGDFEEIPFWPDGFLENSFKEKFQIND